MSIGISENYSCPTPCEVPSMSLAGKRIVVMQRHGRDGAAQPVAVHDSLDNAMADIGRRSADTLLNWCDTAYNALYLVAVDR